MYGREQTEGLFLVYDACDSGGARGKTAVKELPDDV
jgi:hypothetical protein